MRLSDALLASAAREARVALDNGWLEASYNDRENARAARMRHYIGSCQECATAIFEEPGYCVECAFFGAPER